MPSIKEMSRRPDRLAGGHRLCAGCAAPVAIRQMLLATEYPLVISCATGCMEIGTSIYPFTSWRVPWFHSAFENSAATISGVEAMYQSLKKQGKIDREIKFIALGGDGGTYDIGLQSLSGALERGHDFLYLCYDNEAYMNTGIQRSSATPHWASTTTSPAGKVIPGKTQPRKDLTSIVVAHNVPYVAQASPSHFADFTRKVEKALSTEGPTFINVIAPCHRGWRFPMEESIHMARLAVETCFWPLYEVTDGQYKISLKPKEKRPVTDWLKPQGRFRHLFRPGREGLLEEIQAEVDSGWDRLLKLAGEG